MRFGLLVALVSLAVSCSNPDGPTGPAGSKGDTGQTGTLGPQGVAGPVGPQGEAGPQGAAGVQGPSGPQGLQGVAGPQGAAGVQGPSGPQGLQGVTGPQGLAGAQGPAGPAGSRGANWAGTWTDVTRYDVDDAISHEGSSYVAVELPVMGLPPPNASWQLVASSGAPGAEGPQGPQGDPGVQGLPGSGSVVQVDAGAGLTGGSITDSGTIGIATGGVTNAMLANASITVLPGAGLSGGGTVALGGSIGLSVTDLGGDVAGAPGASVVTALQGTAVSASAPADGQQLVYSAALGAWEPVTLPKAATYRYAVFDTYDQASGWIGGGGNGDASLFGGITPQLWSDGSAVASALSPDKEVLRTLYSRKGYARANAVVHSESWVFYSSTNGRFATALFRIRNTTANPIVWAPQVRVTAYGSWGENASIALNGVLTWSSAGGTYVGASGPVTAALSIPGNRTSTAIFVSAGGPPSGTRTTLLAFSGNSLLLPAGLQFVDDLDTATGGWEQ